MRTSTHFVVDLSLSGLDNDNEVFHADDCPCGLIGAVLADVATPDPAPPRIPYPLLSPGRLGRAPTENSAPKGSLRVATRP